MDSNEVKVEKSTSELKHLGVLKEIAAKFLVLLSNIYDFAKEKAGVLGTKVAPVEKAVVSALKPVYQKLKDVVDQQILPFVDDKFDKLLQQFEKYAPALSKKLLAKFQSLVDKTVPLLQKLFTKVEPILKKLIQTIRSLLQKILTILKSMPLFDKAQALLQKGLSTAMSLIKSIPLVGKVTSLLQKGLNGLPLNSILQKGPDLANQALDATKSVVGGIPVVGDIITNPTDAANQLLDSTNSLVNDIPVVGAVNSAAQNIAKEAQATGTKAALQAAYLSFSLVAMPVIAEFWYKADTYPVFHALAEVLLPWIEYLAEEYNKLVKYMDGKGYDLFGYLPVLPINEMKAAYKLVKMKNDSLSAVGDLVPGVGK